MKAKYDGTCQVCGLDFGAGTEITAIAPKGGRRRWLCRHVACHSSARKDPRRGSSKNPAAVRFECPDCGGPHLRGRCREERPREEQPRKEQTQSWSAREHTRSWMTAEQFAVAEEVMAKMVRG